MIIEDVQPHLTLARLVLYYGLELSEPEANN